MTRQEVLQLSQNDLLAKFQTSLDGLTQKEAAFRLTTYGLNVFKRHRVNGFAVFARQFKSSLVYLLFVAGLIALGIQDYTDSAIIFVILAINTSLGFYQEYKSERTVEKLQKFITRQVNLKRDGVAVLVDESQIVPGDVLIVREGDIVPADMRLTEAEGLDVNESQLTGESVPVTKKVAPDASGLLFTGSIIEKGVGTGIVYATADTTELGTIATLSTDTKKQTQYEQSLQAFSSILIRIVLAGLALVFIAKFFFSHGAVSITSLLLFVIALAVSTVPEVLPVIATITLSSGALKLAKQHVVVKRLSAMEDFGNVNLLCTDKTGTITENKMTIKSVVSSDKELFETLAYASITPVRTRKRRMPNTYDDAFASYISEAAKEKAKHFTLCAELPFDPEARRKRVVLEEKGTYFLVSLGAPDALLSVCHVPDHAHYLKDIAKEGATGLHHLAVAYKKIAYQKGFDIEQHEKGLTFLGYASFVDPLRPTAKTTIERAEKLGIKIKLLTGDSREVAQYVGEEIGLLEKGSTVYLGDELAALSPEEFTKAVLASSVFARVSPVQKFNIINALKEHYVVAYQGDGINDAPALKLADVAIAVNSATDIAKENADIVLLNRSLEVIINGIRYGRSIFVNINKYIRYTMSASFGTFAALSGLYLFLIDLPILPVQLLLNNFLTDIPHVMISTDTVDDEDVVRPEHHDIRELMTVSLVLGIPTALFQLLYFYMIHFTPLAITQTDLYVFLTLQGLIIFYPVRTKKHFWQAKAPSTALNISFAAAFVCSLAVIYIPLFQKWFSFVALSGLTLGAIGIYMVAYLLVTDVVKVWYYRQLGPLN